MKRAAAACVLGLSACAQLTGVADLSIDERPRRSDTSAPDAGGPGEEETDGTTRPDSSSTTPDTGTPNPNGDSGTDTAAPACTTLPTNEAFLNAPAAPWILRGDATHAAPGVRLTPSVAGKTGALYWDQAFTFDRFDVTFGYAITTDPASTAYGPGDGLTFAWISAADVPQLGGTGGGLAVSGLTGWAVAVDAYQNVENSDTATPNISIKNTLDMSNIAATVATPALLDGKQHLVRVRLANGSVSVTLDGTEVIGPTALPGYTAFTGFWGFGAGTGGAFEDHLLTTVTARIGTTGPCAAP